MLRKSTQSSTVIHLAKHWKNGKFVAVAVVPQSKLVQITTEIGICNKILQYFPQYNVKH